MVTSVSFNRERAIPQNPVILRGGEVASTDRTTVESQDTVEGNAKGVSSIAFLYTAGRRY